MDYIQFKSYFLSVGIGIFTFKLDNVDYCLSRVINVKHGQVTRGEGYSLKYLNNKIYFNNEIHFVKDVSFDDRSFEEVFPLLKEIYINEMTEEEFVRAYGSLDYGLLNMIAEFNLGKYETFDSLKDCLLNNEKNGNLLLLAGDSELDDLDYNRTSNYFLHYMGRVVQIHIEEMEKRISFLDHDDKKNYSHFKHGRIKDHFNDQRINNERYKDLQTLLKIKHSKSWTIPFLLFIILFITTIVLIINKLYLFAILSFVLCIIFIVFGSVKSKMSNDRFSQLKLKLYNQIPHSFSKFQNEFLNNSFEGFIDALKAKYGRYTGGTPSVEGEDIDLILYFKKFTICIYYMLAHAEINIESADEDEIFSKKYRYIDFESVDDIEATMLKDIIDHLDENKYSSKKQMLH